MEIHSSFIMIHLDLLRHLDLIIDKNSLQLSILPIIPASIPSGLYMLNVTLYQLLGVRRGKADEVVSCT